MRYIITGGLGFIGTNIVRRLNASGVRDITIVDEYSPLKGKNLLDVSISDFIPRDRFNPADHALNGHNDETVIFHMGAKSSTQSSIKDVLQYNIESTNRLLDFAAKASRCRVIYASSASVYGTGQSSFKESEPTRPSSPYSWSKATIDNRQDIPGIGLRFFNVYGPHETHKGAQSSCIRQFWHKFASEGQAVVFGPGPIKRDFIHVDDVVDTCMYFATGQGRSKKGIYNVGTGQAESFNTVALQTAESFRALTGYSCDVVAGISPITNHPGYQRFTCSDPTSLLQAGINNASFKTIDTGIQSYCQWLRTNEWSNSYDA